MVDIITWSDCNNIMLHEDKFEYICHQANRSNLLLQLPFTSTYFEYHTLGGITLHPANNIRYLGVYISDDLSWTLHIATICDKAQQMAAWVFSVFSTRRTDILITYDIVQIIGSLPSRVLFSSVESIQNSRYPEPLEYTANIYVKNRWTQGPPLLGKVEKTLIVIVTKEAGTLHSNTHVENPSWSHI